MSIAPMTREGRPATPRLHRWTADAYERLVAEGYFDGRRVELVGGEIIDMAGQRDEHAMGVSLADYALKAAFGTGFVVRVQLPLRAGEDSIPEPDVAVVRGPLRRVRRHPTTALLVVEVADTTLAFDREDKASLYASIAVRDYWVVNLVEGQVEVRRTPIRTPAARFGWGYRDTTVLRRPEVIVPLAARKARVKVADLLP